MVGKRRGFPLSSEDLSQGMTISRSCSSLDKGFQRQNSFTSEAEENGETSSPGGWLSEHVELVGAPRPPRAADVTLEASRRRSRASQQVEHLASRYTKDHALSRHIAGCKSLPNMKVRKHEPIAVRPQRFRPCGCLEDAIGALRQLLGGEKNERPVVAPLPYDSKDSAVVIFDWDDTLFPTSFVVQMVIPSMGKHDEFLSKDSPHYEALAHHAHVVDFVLRAARKVARVAIVTLSMSPWVEASTERYLPGLNIASLLYELDIQVYYSRGHVREEVKSWDVKLDRSAVPGGQIGMDVDLLDNGSLLVRRVDHTGATAKWNAENPTKALERGDMIASVNGESSKLVNICRREKVLNMAVFRQQTDPHEFVDAKGKDMLAVLERFYHTGAGASWHQNVVSIGDSVTEQQALKELLLKPPDITKAGRGTTSHQPTVLCKTVNLLAQPNLEQLGNELRILMVWLPRMVGYLKNFDLTMDGLDDLERELFEYR
mmetsp:Transcript_82984/g.231550  ORF Transcript_82984/g.231550 Transcript_82984/m.231550 type:complete len:487 (+) Transcript_82984:55-1515(+)